MGTPQERKGLPDDVDQLIQATARKLVRNYGFTKYDREDIEQDLRLHVLEAMPKFDGRRKLIAFATHVIKNEVATIIKRRTAQKRGDGNAPVSLDATRDSDGTPVFSISEGDGNRRIGQDRKHFTDIVDLGIDIADALADQPDALRDLCENLQSRNPTDIQRETGIPRGTLYDRRAKVEEIFRMAGLDDYLPKPPGASTRQSVDDLQEHSNE